MTLFDHRSNEADAFNDYLDDLAMGEPAPLSKIDASLAESVARVHGSGGAQPSPRLKSAIWEDLMSTHHVADPRTVSAPISAKRSAGSSRPGWLPARSPGSGNTHRMAWIAAAIVIVTLLGGMLYSALQPGASDPRKPDSNFAFVGPEESTPMSWPEDTIFPPAEDCTVPVLRINEITAVLQSSYDGWDRQNSQRDLPLTPANNTPLLPPLSQGDSIDEETRAAISQTYYTFVACGNAGSIRQQYWLFSNDGIARALLPNGRPYFYNIALLGSEPSPPGGLSPMPEFSEFRLLADGRVAAFIDTQGGVAVGTPDEMAVRYVIFVNHNGTWYIDDQYCGVCG